MSRNFLKATGAMSIRQSNNYVWSVTELVGQGATGNVFVCRNKKDGKPYAAKVFNTMGQMRVREVRIREIELLRKLDHQNVVTLVAEELEMGSRSTVLIMELCDTSLYNILELPENYFGLSEGEFKCVLQDVARGMKYLREHNVVHRDVKPGNILRIKSPSGCSVYKLTDFGAAKQLNDADQSFISIYGTEEYLHPDVYEKAVMKNFSKKKFTAAVDLWSMGVTFYHAATGQLPFRPYGGRQNKETMFEIISKKGPKVISGIQRANGGRIEYDDDLPEETRISKGLKILLRPILQELLETTGEGLENLITFDQFYSRVEAIVAKKVIDVFCTNASTWHKIYAKGEEPVDIIQNMIASQTGINIEHQQVFLSFEEFKPSSYRTVNDLPVINKENPLIVVGGEAIESSQLHQRRIPKLPKMPTNKTRPESDIDTLKIYASVCYMHMFSAKEFYFCSRTTDFVFKTMEKLMNSKLKKIDGQLKLIEGRKMLLEQVTFQSNRDLNRLKHIFQTLLQKDSNADNCEVMLSKNKVNDGNTQQLQKILDDAKTVSLTGNFSLPSTHLILNTKNWMDEIKILANEVNDIYVHISKGKIVGHGNLEDLIYSAKKQQIMESLNTMKTRFNSLAEVRQDYHIKFNAWLKTISKKYVDISNVEASLESTDEIIRKLYAEHIESISTEKCALLQEVENLIKIKENEKRGSTSNTSLTVMEAEVSSLEGILQDILILVEEGDQKLMSSKEIFEELSVCDS